MHVFDIDDSNVWGRTLPDKHYFISPTNILMLVSPPRPNYVSLSRDLSK